MAARMLSGIANVPLCRARIFRVAVQKFSFEIFPSREKTVTCPHGPSPSFRFFQTTKRTRARSPGTYGSFLDARLKMKKRLEYIRNLIRCVIWRRSVSLVSSSDFVTSLMHSLIKLRLGRATLIYCEFPWRVFLDSRREDRSFLRDKKKKKKKKKTTRARRGFDAD